MAILNNIFYTLMLLALCTMSIDGKVYREKERDRKNRHREPSSLASQHHIIESKVMPINLCSKGRDLKFVCHCSPDGSGDNSNVKPHKAECWIIRSDLSANDPDWTVFHTQTQLQSLAFSVHGTGSLSFIPASVILQLVHLKKLTIEYARIHEIYGFAFGNFTRIHNISLPNNQIRVLNAYAFSNHMELQELNLCHNEISDIDPFAFINLPNLNRINLHHNRIETLQDDTFENLDKLTELVLSHNDLFEVRREMLKGLANLWVLKIDNNKLRNLRECIFSDLWSLIELDLGHNNIDTISEQAFDGLNNLKRLNLEHNRLKSLERGTFTSIPALTYLNLMRNALETVTLGTVQPLMNNLVNHTSMMLIKDNEFICDCRLAWLYDLKNRTRNYELRYSLEEVECKKLKDQKPSLDVGSENVIEAQMDYNDDESNDDKKVNLLSLIKRDLPCPQEYREQLQEVHKGEFIKFGFGLSHWIGSSATSVEMCRSSQWILILALVSQFLCTFGAFFR